MVSEELTCDNAGRLKDQMVNTNQRILELRNEETRKLERKLRREKQPIEVLKLLNVQSTSKTNRHEKYYK